jgi:hypothetical protein
VTAALSEIGKKRATARTVSLRANMHPLVRLKPDTAFDPSILT